MMFAVIRTCNNIERIATVEGLEKCVKTLENFQFVRLEIFDQFKEIPKSTLIFKTKKSANDFIKKFKKYRSELGEIGIGLNYRVIEILPLRLCNVKIPNL